MDGKSIVIADADALLALVNHQDTLHPQAVAISTKLADSNVHILFPITAITEAVTKIQRVFTNPQLAQSLLDMVYQDESAIVDTDKQLLKTAKSYFNPQASKQNTLFDCLIAATAKKYGAQVIFSFDVWYPKLGFTLAADWTKA